MLQRFTLLVGLLVALAAHLLMGWAWSVLGPLSAGFLSMKRGAWNGLVVLVLAWGGIMAWNVAAASQESLNMMETLGGLLGGMPALVVPVATLLIAARLGAVAGWLGHSLKPRKKS